ESAHHGHQSFWLWVMCLTGVDYFSTLGYQPSIGFEAVGLLAPMATVVLVLVTLGCALPIYSKVAEESPLGQGSIAMLERLLRGWRAKILVLILLGFAATDFVITKTLSAADAAEHLIHNPLWGDAPDILQSQMVVTMTLLVGLGAMFLRGFKEVIAIAVTIVTVYLTLNLIVIGSGLYYLAFHGEEFREWYTDVHAGNWYFEHEGSGWLTVIAACILFFPKLALGLSGFETGVAVMPLVKGDPDDDPHKPMGRIRNTRKLLATAALIMSVLLLGSSTVITTLIEPEALLTEGQAQNRALAFIAHGQTKMSINPLFGERFGTIYDMSTVAILWFAGASAMSGLLNLVPRYLPRYGMAPRWAEAVRALVIVFTLINLLVTWVFGASVVAQSGAYATGVLVLMSSAAVAVVIDQWRARSGSRLARIPWGPVVAMIVFFYTTVAVIIEKPDGIKIAATFILATLVFSFISRLQRSKELRFEKFDFVDDHSRFLWDALRHLEFPVLVPHRPGHHTIEQKDERMRRVHRLNEDVPIVFVEAVLGDTSEFEHNPLLEVVEEEGRFIVRLKRCASIAHAVATVALELSKTGKPPEIHFGWSDESPLAANLGFLLFGEGNVPWIVRELIQKSQPDSKKRPRVIIG
ncbi:MAG: amino acid transporter, partial [Pirellulales bacterium]